MCDAQSAATRSARFNVMLDQWRRKTEPSRPLDARRGKPVGGLAFVACTRCVSSLVLRCYLTMLRNDNYEVIASLPWWSAERYTHPQAFLSCSRSPVQGYWPPSQWLAWCVRRPPLRPSITSAAHHAKWRFPVSNAKHAHALCR